MATERNAAGMSGTIKREGGAPDPARWPTDATRIARRFHETYEQLAPSLGYRTRLDSAVPWEEVPERNRLLMVQTIVVLLLEGVIVDPGCPAAVEPDDSSMGTEGRRF